MTEARKHLRRTESCNPVTEYRDRFFLHSPSTFCGRRFSEGRFHRILHDVHSRGLILRERVDCLAPTLQLLDVLQSRLKHLIDDAFRRNQIMQLSRVTALALVASEPWWLAVQPNWRSKSGAVAVANQISRRRVECEHRKVREVQPAAARHAAKHKSDEQRLKQKLVICVAQ